MSAQQGSSQPGYEVRDARPRSLVVFALGLTALTLAVILSSVWLASAFRKRAAAAGEPNPMASFRETPAGPLLQPNPAQELASHRRWEDERLEGYAWIDRENGVVRIPIRRAMELVLERGLPARAKDEGGR